MKITTRIAKSINFHFLELEFFSLAFFSVFLISLLQTKIAKKIPTTEEKITEGKEPAPNNPRGKQVPTKTNGPTIKIVKRIKITFLVSID